VVGALELEEREVLGRVRAEDLRPVGPTVADVPGRDLGRALDDVVVREDRAGFADHHPGAGEDRAVGEQRAGPDRADPHGAERRGDVDERGVDPCGDLRGRTGSFRELQRRDQCGGHEQGRRREHDTR
jgi:hypothetical protein